MPCGPRGAGIDQIVVMLALPHLVEMLGAHRFKFKVLYVFSLPFILVLVAFLIGRSTYYICYHIGHPFLFSILAGLVVITGVVAIGGLIVATAYIWF